MNQVRSITQKALRVLLSIVLVAGLLPVMTAGPSAAWADDTLTTVTTTIMKTSPNGLNAEMLIDVLVNGESYMQAYSLKGANASVYKKFSAGDEVQIKPYFNDTSYVVLQVTDGTNALEGPDSQGYYSYTIPNDGSKYATVKMVFSQRMTAQVSAQIEHGSVSLSYSNSTGMVSNDKLQYTSVYATPDPAEGYYCSQVSYSLDGGTSWTAASRNDDGTWEFTPKAADVLVTAEFAVDDRPETVEISTEQELRDFATAVNGGKWFGYQGITVTLKNDISLSDSWVPIGTYENPFCGTFDGQGHAVSGMTIAASISETGHFCYGLFGAVEGAVRNVSVNGSVSVTFDKNASGENYSGATAYVGGVVGYACAAQMSDCTNNAAVSVTKNNTSGFAQMGGVAGCVVGVDSGTGTTLLNCKNYGTVQAAFTGSAEAAGGIVGAVGSYGGPLNTIENCANYGKITASCLTYVTGNTGDPAYGNEVNYPYGAAGGIAGTCEQVSIKSCCNKGNLQGTFGYACGGIAGVIVNQASQLTMSDCYNTGNITVENKACKTSATGVGGLAGAHCGPNGTGPMSSTSVAPTNGTFNASNCYNAGSITVTQTESYHTDYIFTDALMVLANGTCSNNYSEKCTASQLGSAYKEDANMIQEGWPLLTWESTEAVAEKHTVAFEPNVDAQVNLYADAAYTQLIGQGLSFSLVNGTYYYSVSAEGYVAESGQVRVNGEDVSVSLMLARVAQVTFGVSPAAASVLVTDADGSTVQAAADGSYSLKLGQSYAYTVEAKGYISWSDYFTAQDGATVSVALLSHEGVTDISGTGYHITEAGTYYIPADYTGMIYLDTVDVVTLEGSGITDATKRSNVFIDATVEGVNLTLQNLYISDTANMANVIDFDGTGNNLSVEGTVILDYDVGYTSSNDALIHVAQGESLTIQGAGTYYQYNCTQGAGIGGNTGELNGDITFSMTGSLFAKGTKQGAVIGSGADSASAEGMPGSITFLGGTYNLISNSRGAVIGGAAGSNGASAGTTVYIQGGSVNVNCDYSGSAVGGGGYAAGSDASGGTLYVTGGSLRTYVDTNAAKNVSGAYWKGLPLVEGVNNVAVTAQRLNADGEDVYLCALDTTGIEPDEDGCYTVTVDGEEYFSGQLHSYAFTQEAVDREISGGGAAPSGITYTPDNWVKSVDPCLYVYLTGENHSIQINGVSRTASYNEDALGTAAETNGGAFTVTESAPAPTGEWTAGDVNNSGSINIVDAQVAYDLATGRYGVDYTGFTLPDGWNVATLLAAADANTDGSLDASDALAIQYYVHFGVFGTRE